jgi:hypothetical protein
MATIYMSRDCRLYSIVKRSSELEKRGDAGVDVHKGQRFETIRYIYLPSHIMDDIDEYVLRSIKAGEAFIIYYKRKYLLVNRSEAEMTKY